MTFLARSFPAIAWCLAFAAACTGAPADRAETADSTRLLGEAHEGVAPSLPGAAAGTLADSLDRVPESVADSFATFATDASDAALDSGVTLSDLVYLRSRNLLIPVPGVDARNLPNTFDEARSGGERRHDAMDILAPRGTPVLSTDRGRVVRIDTSHRGGLSLYAADPSGHYMYYYAHLDAYARGLHDGQPLQRGDTLGYVGTTGNAPPNTPHLHFAINRLDDSTRWWSGTPINPWRLLARPRP